ncbi:MAG: DUF1810 domain-containing protein [Acetobacteraceae bacterium]|nr:DUF1810 domain-containing protein [Acetobacteraceae bacterium]
MAAPDLSRVVAAQEPVIAQLLAELREGRRRTHRMRFVFPQLRALGRSATALHDGLADLAQARACAPARARSSAWRGAACTRSPAAPTTSPSTLA